MALVNVRDRTGSTIAPTGTISPTERVARNWIDGDWADSADHWDSFDPQPDGRSVRTRTPAVTTWSAEIVIKNIAIAVVSIVVGLWGLASLAADAASQPIVVAQTGGADRAMTDGEVKKVDKDAGKLTIKHGPLTNLDMPGMTMAFRGKDPAMLDQVKEGDKIRFVADRVNGAITVVELKPVK